MRKLIRALHGVRALCAAVALLLLLPSVAAQAEKRVALVIGNSNYRHVPALVNPTNDAADISRAFERLGFSVSTLTNATYDDLRRGLLAFGRLVRNADIAVVFFAGHGIEVGGDNWLIPVDAELKSDIDVEHEAMNLRGLLPAVENARKLGLVILDACRNNPFNAKMQRTIRTRAVSRGLAGIEPSGNVLVAYAAKDGTTAADGDGRNSPFTASLLKYVETPGLEINFLFRNVRDEVIKTTARAQQPFVYGSLSREAIYLKEAPKGAARPAGPSPDEVAWSFLKDTSDPDALKRFVEQYPTSPYRATAEQRIVFLTKVQSAEAAAIEQRMAALTAANEKAKAAPAPQIDAKDMTRLLQFELKRVGCFNGAVNGKLDPSTRGALQNFSKLASISLPEDVLSGDALKAIRGIDKRVCPLLCKSGERAEGDNCVRIVCPADQVLKGDACVDKPDDASKKRITERPNNRPRPAAPSAGNARGGKCFAFNGRTFCE
jgi:hypothetical protein